MIIQTNTQRRGAVGLVVLLRKSQMDGQNRRRRRKN